MAPRKTQIVTKGLTINIVWPNHLTTPTILALGFLTGNLALLPMIAWLGDSVPADYAGVVKDVVGLFKDAMLLIIGYYFAKGQAPAPEKNP